MPAFTPLHEPPISQGKSTRLLLLEDNPGDADFVCELLELIPWTSFTVTHSPRLTQALELLRGGRWDVILLDISLPDSDGPSIVTRVREVAGGAAIIVLTGQDDESTENSAVQTGAQEFLHKNQLDSRTLSRALRHAMERERLFSQIQSLVEALADATVVVSNDGRIRFVNPAAERLFGRTRHGLLGEPFFFPMSGEAEVEFRENGERRHLEIRSSTLDWMGEPARLASLRDVTDRKRAADFEKKLLHAERLAAIGQLAAGVAHEVNNPATYVMANLSLWQEEVEIFERLSEEVRGATLLRDGQRKSGDALLVGLKIDETLSEWRKMVDENLDGMQRIVKIVQDLKTFGRIEQQNLQPVDLNSIVRAASGMLTNEIRHRASLIEDLGPIPLIEGDRGKLTQVLLNLLLNASQAIETGRSSENKIRVASFAAGGRVWLEISDTGSGMSPAVLQSIFEPFFTTKPREQGTGLGLSLSREIIRQHGGEILATSEEGKGSTFRLWFPASAVPGARPEVSAPKPSPRVPPRMRILLIDDEPMVLQSVRRLLGRWHDVELAQGGKQGLEILAKNAHFDVIFCDLMMPDLDGEGFYKALAERSPRLARRVAFCSGGAFTPQARQFLDAVSNPCIEKPASSAELLRVIERISREESEPLP